MSKKNRVKLRNKLMNQLNAWEALGCKAHSGMTPGPKKKINAKERYFWRFVMGTAKDGRTILIYPVLHPAETLPNCVAEYMTELDSLGALVGCAAHMGDAWCIVSDNPAEYKRSKYTYYFRYWFNKKKEQKNGQTSRKQEQDSGKE